LISIRKSVDDLSRLEALEKREALAKAIGDCYALAIHSTAHYAVEVDPALATAFRDHLKGIEEQSLAAISVQQLHLVQSSFRGELREYRDKSNEQLVKMRREVESATAAMSIFADTVSSSGEDHEKEVANQLKILASATRSDDIREIRGSIGAVVTGIQSSVEQMQRCNQLVILQLQDEIRVLHQQFEQERKALFTDRSSGAWNRQKVDIHLDNVLRQNQPFCMLLIAVRNLKRIESQHSRTVFEGALQALISRLRAITGDEAVIGRWAEDQFVVIVDVPPGRAIPLSAEATRKLSGGYAIQENGLSHTVAVQVTAGVIDRNPGSDSALFRKKLDQLAGAISGS
jgi:GGDEF domain-containing protein